MQGRLVYVADAMCSWCWGFAPALEALTARHPELSLELIPGGLRPGPAAQPLNDALRGYLRHTWAAVQKASGQPFAWSFLDRDAFVYDTEPAARAQLAVRAVAPQQEFAYFKALQSGFYAHGRDITQVEVQIELARQCGVDESALATELRTADLGQRTVAQYRRVKSMGVRGFPTLLLMEGDRPRPVCTGFLTANDLLSRFQTLARASASGVPG